MVNLTALTFLTIAVVSDFQQWQISNRLIVTGLMIGLVLRLMGEGSAGIVHFLMNISIPVISLFLLFRLRVIGAGDIKLFSMTGGFLSAEQLVRVMITAFLAAAVIGLGKLIYDKKPAEFFWEKQTRIHFSLAILIAYIIVVWGCAIA